MSLWLGCIEMQKKTNVQKQLNYQRSKKVFFLVRLGNILCLKKIRHFVVVIVVAVIFNLLLKLYAIEKPETSLYKLESIPIICVSVFL